MKTILYTKEAPKPIGPYNQGIELKNLIMISGQIPIDPISGVIPEDISDQTKLVLHHIQSVISSSGLNVSNIVKTTIYTINLNYIKKINTVYENFFLSHKTTFPARSCIEISRLPKDVKIEIDAIAVK